MKIEMTDINKTFASAKVLNNAQFSLADGEIHALMGENGAGKSTLMKILTGVYQMDKGSGRILVDGAPALYRHPTEAERAGIVFIHQELNVVPDLTVEEKRVTKRGAFLVILHKPGQEDLSYIKKYNGDFGGFCFPNRHLDHETVHGFCRQ